MKKLTIFFGILLVSFSSFGQYTTDKTPANLTKTTTLSAADWLVVEKSTDNYVKAITAYDSYVYYRRCLDSIINLNVSGDLNVVDRIDAFRIYADMIEATALFASSFMCDGDSYFTDMVNIQDTLFAYFMKMLPLDTISSSYCLALDPTDSVIKLAPMSDGIPDFNNVAYVNYDLTGDLESQLIFDSYASAAAWINANGSPATDNHWTIVMPSGYCDEDVVADEFIDIQGHVGTVINSISSKVVSTGVNILDVTIKNCIIDTLWIDEGKILTLRDCILNTVQPVDGAGTGYAQFDNCTILGGDFSNTTGLLPWENNMFLAFESDIENLISVGASTEFQGCVFVSYPTYSTHSIIELPYNIYNGRALMEQAFSMSVNPHWRNSVISCSDSATFEDGAKIKNCDMKIDTINVTGGNFVTYNSEITGAKILSSNATIELHQSVANGGNIDLYDTAMLKIYDGSEIDGDVIQVDPTTAINDYRSTYAEIYYSDASTAQSIPTGTTYTKWTAFTTDGESNNCTADAANDKITITEAGTYFVQGNFSTSCGTDSVTASKALFVGGSEVNKIHKLCMFSTQTNAQEGSISGLIKVTDAQVPVDIDVRIRHDNVSDVNFTGIYGNLTVYKIAY
jgi:hypothetical protein